MDDDTSSAIGSIMETIEDLKSRITALEGDAQKAADAAKELSDGLDERLQKSAEPLGARLDYIEAWLGGVLPNQILSGGGVVFNRM